MALGACVLAWAGGAQARWLKAESPHFIVYGAGTEAALRVYANKLEDFDQLLRTYHGVKDDGQPFVKLEVVLTGSSGLRVLYPHAPEGTAGFYNASIYRIVAVSNNAAAPGDYVLFHEYTHHFMAQHFPYGYPHWMVEGYAEYFASTEIKDNTINVGKFTPDRVIWLFAREWIPLRKVLGNKSWSGGEQAMMYYTESWLLTHYMFADADRRQQLDAYLKAVGRGEPSVEAMEKATGLTVAQLQTKLHAYSRIPYTQLSRLPRINGEVKITPLPPAADDLFLLQVRNSLDVNQAERAEHVRLVRSAAARHPKDSYAEIVLAQAEARYGDPALAEQAMRQRVAVHPDDIEALRTLAEAQLREGEEHSDQRAKFLAAARPSVAAAYRADPSDYEALYDYARSHREDQEYPSENVLKALLEAHALAPQVEEISIQAAQALIIRKRFDEAANLLNPIAYDPHGGESVTNAKKLLAQLPDAAKPAAAPSPDG